MVTAKADHHRKREYILVKHGQSYYYARADYKDPNLYTIMTNVGEREGTEIIEKANEQSAYNREADEKWQERVTTTGIKSA